MIRHFFLDKTATITNDTMSNTGLNPILSLVYGSTVSRGLVHFNVDEIAAWIEENGLNQEKMTFRLKMTNCMSVDEVPYHKNIVHAQGRVSERASSFTLDFYHLEKPFDAGRGYDYESDFLIDDKKSYTENGANWKYCSGNTKWNGAVSETSEMIAQQHFDFGNENMDVDITDYVFSLLSGERDNNGVVIKFCNEIENVFMDNQQYIGFFTNNTNTFFHPYVEVIYDEVISDDRECFYNGFENRLYLYVASNGSEVPLDELPVCDIDGVEWPVTMVRNGVYYATVSADYSKDEEMTIKYDNWSNLYFCGTELEPIDMEFTVLPKQQAVVMGSKSVFENILVPSISGIDDNEDLGVGEIREVVVDLRMKYTTFKKQTSATVFYNIYTKDANREIDVFPYQQVEKAFLNNYFIVNTNDMVPGKYFVDIEVRSGRETRFYKDVLHFNVKSNITEKYY